MGAVWMIGTAEIRRRWRSVVVLTVLVGFVGGTVLALAAGARRTDSSLQRFERNSRAGDVEVDIGEATPAQVERFRHSPGVAAVAELYQLNFLDAQGKFPPTAAQIDDRFGRIVDRPRVIEGRKANLRNADELTVGEGLAAQLHLHVGDRTHFRTFSLAQTEAGIRGEDIGDPTGPIVRLRVVGIVRRPLDLGGRGAAGGVIVPTPAFLAANRDKIGSFSGGLLRVRTDRGAADIPRVAKEARRIFGSEQEAFGFQNLSIEGEGARNAIDVTTSALFIAAAVAALAGLVALGIALAREISLSDPQQLPLRALGMSPQHRIAAAAAIGVPIGLGGAVLAVVGGVLASSFFPIGVAAKAEPSPGIRVDGLVLSVGFLAVIVVVLAVVVFAAARTARASERVRPTPRPAIAARAASGLAVPPTMEVGLGFALDRGNGRRALPVRSSLVGVSFGVVIVVAVLMFSASLNHLASTPRDYGWTWDRIGGDAEAGAVKQQCGPIKTRLARDASLAAVASICTLSAEVEGRPVGAWGFTDVRGHIGPTIVEGRAPRSNDEVALGARTLAAVHRHIGDRVRIGATRGPLTYRIVGRTVLPTIEDPQPLDDGAAFTGRGLDRIDEPDQKGGEGSWKLVVRFAPNADKPATTKHLRNIAGNIESSTSAGPAVPAEIDRVRQIDGLPIALAVFVGGVAMFAVGYALVVAARRRRRDLAILKTLGFTRAQVRATMAWHATTVSVIGLIVGIPLGLVLGRFVWASVANGFGVSTDPTWPMIGILVLIPVALILLNLVAAIPARTAARTRPAVVLRSE